MLDPFEVLASLDDQKVGGPSPVEVGVVTSLSPLMADCSGGPELVTAMAPYVPAIGDAAVMLRARGITVLVGRVAANQPSPIVPDVSFSGTDYFPAAYSYSWRDGTPFDYTVAVRQGATDSSGAWVGAWFYQQQPGSLSGATVTACSVKVTRATGGTAGTQAISLYRSSAGTWPLADLNVAPVAVGGVVTQALAVGGSAWVALPVSLGQALVDGDFGLMIDADSPAVILQGVDADPESGLLRIDWTR